MGPGGGWLLDGGRDGPAERLLPEAYLARGGVETSRVRSMLALVWEVGVMPAEESAFDSGKGITTIEIRKAAPLMAATANWATGLTGSMAVVSLPFKSTPSYRS